MLKSWSLAILLVTAVVAGTIGCTSAWFSTTSISELNRMPANHSEVIEAMALVNRLFGFESDGCRKFSQQMNYPKMDKWGLCCVQHDISYWKGGTAEDKHAADQRLQNCMIEVGEPNIARLLYWGVRSASAENSSRWGYGWLLPRGHAPFSDAEIAQVEKLEKEIPTELDRVAIVTPEKLTRYRGSLTGNACVDASLTFVQNHLARKLTPMNAQVALNENGATGIEYSVSFMTKECHAPYKFTYTLKHKNSCTRAARERVITRDITLKDIDYPAECAQ